MEKKLINLKTIVFNGTHRFLCNDTYKQSNQFYGNMGHKCTTKKKFGKRPPPGIIVTTTQERVFENVISTYGTATPIQTQSFKIEKYEILKPINFNQKVKKGDVIADLKNRKIIAQFDGVIGKREFSEDIEVSKSSILINLEDTSSIYSAKSKMISYREH